MAIDTGEKSIVPVPGVMPAALPADRRTVEDWLYEEPYYFDFFQAVRLLLLLSKDRKPPGLDFQPSQEVVRLRSHVSLLFPPSQLYHLERPKDTAQPPELTVAFMGLAGVVGALPRHYAELILDRARRKDFTLRDFLDLFNHRLLSLFFRAGQKYRHWLHYEYAEFLARLRHGSGSEAVRAFMFEERPRWDPFSQDLLELQGVGAPSIRYRSTTADELQPRLKVDDEALRFYTGLFAQRHRSAVGLENILNDYFGVEVRVQQFSGQWLNLPEENQTCLLPEGGNTILGFNALVGDRVWDLQSKFRIRVGPLNYRQFCDFLPSGTALGPLAHLSRLYAGFQFDFDVQLVLLANEVPPCELSRAGHDGARLGWDAWSRSQEFTHDVDDAIFRIQDDGPPASPRSASADRFSATPAAEAR